jgi:hypothetical protein
MKVTKEYPPPMPPAEYVLRLSYEELHDLYHTMLDLGRCRILSPAESDFYQALKEHA